MLVDVLGRRHAADLIAEQPQALQELCLRRKTAGDETGLALRGVPAAEALDHRLRVDGRSVVTFELTHRG